MMIANYWSPKRFFNSSESAECTNISLDNVTSNALFYQSSFTVYIYILYFDFVHITTLLYHISSSYNFTANLFSNSHQVILLQLYYTLLWFRTLTTIHPRKIKWIAGKNNCLNEDESPFKEMVIFQPTILVFKVFYVPHHIFFR